MTGNKNIEKYIIEKLEVMKPHKAILFGSYAWGNPGPSSDIDLLIVTKDDFIPASFHEKNLIYCKWAKVFEEIEKDFPLDLVVHTIPMHQKFLRLNSYFSKEIVQKGKVLYETDNA